MPRRKRKDPDEAPIDGDYAFDQVMNKQKGVTYKWLSTEDIPRFKALGFTREDRGPESARPVFDAGTDSDPDYRNGSLTLYKAPNAIAERVDAVAQARADRRMSSIRSEAKASGGEFTTQVHR